MKRDADSALPIVLTSLADARCTVVGGGGVAQRKILALGEAGARRIRVISPELTPALQRLERERAFEWLPRRYRRGDLAESFLAIAASNEPAANRAVAAEAAERRMLVNVADAPELANFDLPATVRRGDLLLAVSTSGISPTLAVRVRDELRHRYGPEYSRLLSLLAWLRPTVADRVAAPERRRCFWRSLTADSVLASLRGGHAEQVEDHAARLLAHLADSPAERVEENNASPTALPQERAA